MNRSTPPKSPHAFYRPRLSRQAFAPRYVGSWLVVALLWAMAWLPLGLSRAFGAALGLLMMAANKKRRDIVRMNLSLCFPLLPPKRRARLARAHFIKSAQALVDLGFLTWAGRRRILKKTYFRGLDNLREQLGKRNVILLAPHVVGLNYGGALLCHVAPVFSMAKPQRNPWVNWLLNRARARFGGEFFLRQQGLRPVLRALREGRPFYYLPDEDLGPERSVFAPFFGVPAATLTTLGRLAQSVDAVVIPCFTKLLPGGRGTEIILYPPLKNFPQGDRTQDATRMNAAMEEGLRALSEQYLWTFKIFKTRPPGEPSLYPLKPKRG
jgi:lauroyl/myristoyl acyltransferase